MLALGLGLLIAAAAPAPNGAQLYTTHCASCHGDNRWGTQDGPTLRGVGAASLDFYLMTGRMPAAVPYVQVGARGERTGQQLPIAQIRALEAYLAPTVAGGPAVPEVVANGDLAHGRALYEANCEQCHGVGGDGGDLGGLTWVPKLHDVSIDVVADAIRAGPGEMPQFGEHQITQADLDDVASYVMHMQVTRQPAVVPPFRSTGPVPEGAVGYVAILALVAFVFMFWRIDTPVSRREDAVRRDEGKRRA